MAKWRVTFHGTCNCQSMCVVEAETEQEAKDIADSNNDIWGPLTYGDVHDESELTADLITEE